MRTAGWWVLLASVMGCHGKGTSASAPGALVQGAAAAPKQGPLPVVLGDCAGVATAWTSAPHPQPVHDDDLARMVSPAEDGGRFVEHGWWGGRDPGDPDAGRYGTIPGAWAGVGTDPTKLDGRATGPTVAIGQPTIAGDVDRTIIRRNLKRNLQKLLYCYEKALLVAPGIAGVLQVKFVIAPTGVVESVSANGVHREVQSCVATAIQGIEFPRPRGTSSVHVSYPFTFSPGAATAASRPVTAEPPPPPAPPPPPPPPPAEYMVGLANPLRSHTDELVACFQQSTHPYGVAVIEIAFDANGAATSAGTHGDLEEPVRTCVATVAKTATRGRVGAATLQCALAFGAMPASALPTITVGPAGDAIALDGAPLAVDDRAGDSALAARAHAVKVRARGDVAIDGPYVVAPAPGTPWPAVFKVLAALATTDSVLAVQDGAGLRTLEPVAVPAPPVPVGTGLHWSRLESRARSLDHDVVRLSVMIEPDQITVGVSRVNEFQVFARGPDQAAALAEALKTRKASAFFAMRVDLEIAAADTVPYRDVVTVIDAATRAGFVGWLLTSPGGLAAKAQLQARVAPR